MYKTWTHAINQFFKPGIETLYGPVRVWMLGFEFVPWARHMFFCGDSIEDMMSNFILSPTLIICVVKSTVTCRGQG